MAALNFPDPNVQTSYTNPDTGITYEWSNGIWKAVRTAQTAPELFVDVDGDNLTGNLTLGTDKIVLNATDGSATFAERLQAHDAIIGSETIGNNSTTLLNIKSSVISNVFTADGKCYFGYSPANPTDSDIILDGANGSASFSGLVKTGSDNASLATGSWIQDMGGVYTTRPAGSSDSAFACFQQGTPAYTASINADGSASFANGSFVVNSAGIIQTNLYSSGTLHLDSTGSFNGPKVVLSAIDGSGVFSGTVAATQGAGNYVNLQPNGLIISRGGNGGVLYTGRNGSSGADVITFNDSGAATFASEVVAGVRDSQGVFMTSGGALEGFNGGSRKYSLGADGSASFSGLVKTGSDNASLATGSWIQDMGGVYTTRPAGSSDSAFACFQQGTPAYTASINADGSASFANGSFVVNSAGIIQTNLYSSGTLHLDSTGSFNGPKVVLSAIDGSGVFSGTVAATQGAGNYVNLQPNGLIISRGGNGGVLYTGRNGSSGADVITFNDSGAATFTGNITAGNVSDIKFKENITDAHPQLDDVVTLGSSLKNWDWKEEAPLNEELKSKRFLGLIAQEAEEVCPSLTYEVGEGKDSYKAINHDILVMKLLGAVAELKAEVEALKAK